MEFKGTKGEWNVSAMATPATIARIDIGDNKDIRLDASSNVTLEEENANAKLIAATPDLLDALQAAIIELEMYIPVTDVKVLDKGYAAINKALQ